jgi:diguanylate cyclase (GGDEF)-like protein
LPLSRGLFLRFLAWFAIAAVIVPAALALFYRMERAGHVTRLLQESRHTLELERQYVDLEMGEVLTHLALAAQSGELQRFLETPGADTREALAREYLAFCAATGKYDQVRYLDETGMERVRVNYNGGRPEIVGEGELQNKAKRYYFSDAITLHRGEVYASPFDLNIEGKAIEMPFKPMVRLATPVFDGAGRKRGVVVLNYLGARLLDRLRGMQGGSRGRTALLNSDGYWLLGPGPGEEWAFMFPERKGRAFSARHPEEWALVRGAESGQRVGAYGAVTFVTVRPVDRRVITGTGSSEAFAGSAARGAAVDYHWKLLSVLPSAALEEEPRRLAGRLAWLGAGLLAFGAAGAWALAAAGARREIDQRRLRELALHDALTGLPNRTLFRDRLEQSLGEAQRYGRRCALLFLDLDGFKRVNDTLGHDAGDLLLKLTAERLRRAVRASDTVARIGGDEFTVLLPEIASREGAALVAEKLVAALALPFSLGGRSAGVSASVGVCLYPEDAADADGCLSAADGAMYCAKQAGKNRVRCAGAEVEAGRPGGAATPAR